MTLDCEPRRRENIVTVQRRSRGHVWAGLSAFAIGFGLSVPAMACIETPETIHAREIQLVDDGLKTFKREPAVLAKAKELRDRADLAFKGKRFDEATKDRYAALTALGYKDGLGAFHAGQIQLIDRELKTSKR